MNEIVKRPAEMNKGIKTNSQAKPVDWAKSPAEKVEGRAERKEELFEACMKRTWLDVRCLLKRGHDLTWSDEQNMNPLHYACLGRNYSVALKMVHERPEAFRKNSSELSDKDETPLLLACRLGHVDLVELLFNHSSPGMHNRDGETPLHIACIFNQLSVVNLLLRLRESDLDAKDYTNDTPLHRAIGDGHTDIASVLLDKGADVNCLAGESGYTALLHACYEDHWDIMDMILEKASHVDLHTKDSKHGYTALHLACVKENAGAVESLLAIGASPKIRDGDRSTPLHLASVAGHVRIVQFLLASGADVNAINKERDTALSAASLEGHAQVVQLLLRFGAKLHPGDCHDPISLANLHGHDYVSCILLNHIVDQYVDKKRWR
ncbi:hypothetical protein ACOMHN_062105 [Nucella lapillus]